NDGVYETLVATTTTNAAGMYVFDGLTPDDYRVVVNATLVSGAYVGSAPTGYTLNSSGDPDGTADNAHVVVVGPGDVYVNADFGYTPQANITASIGDRVWLDADVDGVQDAGEPGLAGITVALIRDTNSNGLWNTGEVIIATTVTDANGNYLFPGIPVADGTGADDYLVWVNDIANLTRNLTPTYDSNGIASADISSVINLAPAGNLVQDFGYAPYGQSAGEGLIGDTVFLDRDGDFTADAGEGLAGVTVGLYVAGADGVPNTVDDLLFAQTTTDANGTYWFPGLNSSGTFTVVVNSSTLPGGGAGLTATTDPQGPFDGRAIVTLNPAAPINLDQDFGYTPVIASQIQGTIWADANSNGVLNGATETNRFSGVTVQLRSSSGAVVATTTTDAAGFYSFTGLPAGTYTVDVTDTANVLDGAWHTLGSAGAAGNSQTDPYSVSVAAGATGVVDFGYYKQLAALGDLVWVDWNGDGGQNDGGGTGRSGVTVTLTVTYPSGDITTLTRITDSSGLYSFAGLLADESYDGVGGGEPTFVVSRSTPTGFTSSPVHAGGFTAATDSDSALGQSVNLSRGAADATIDFGLTPNPVIAIETYVNTYDADTTGAQPTIAPGAAVSFRYEVTNPGAVPLTNVVVSDNNGAAADITLTLLSSGNGDSVLDPGETWVYTASSTSAGGQYTAVGSVTAVPTAPFAGLGNPAPASDPVNYAGGRNAAILGPERTNCAASNTKIVDLSTGEVLFSLTAYEPAFVGGMSLATGPLDFRFDGDEIVTAPGPGRAPEIRVFSQTGTATNATTGATVPITSFMAYASTFTSGVELAVGDINNDGVPDIVARHDGADHLRRVLSLLRDRAGHRVDVHRRRQREDGSSEFGRHSRNHRLAGTERGVEDRSLASQRR
ncbi:MAG TPA: SdrD B-like domain-containing protein, partial [Pirellulaceae bacterium]|nr:SdrD B-like domain-containing protein [Pirellulaceae bacterium]